MLHQNKNILSLYKDISKIGKGTYSTVFKAKHIATDIQVAIKACKLNPNPKLVQKHLQMLIRELTLLH